MALTPAQLVANAECYNCAMTEKQMMAAMVYLLCSGAGAGVCIICGVGAPTGAPVCPCSLYYTKETNPGVWIWNSDTAAWVSIIASGP
jgi:hypothetical protein